MRTYLSNTRGVLLLSVLLMASSAAVAAADDLLKGDVVIPPANELNVMAAGAVEDTLKACVGRIPLDASAGQRLLAEQNCVGEDGARKLVPDSHKF